MLKHDSPWHHRSPAAAAQGLGLTPGLAPGLVPGLAPGSGMVRTAGADRAASSQERVPLCIATTIFE